MKLTKNKLKQIIKEELQSSLNEMGVPMSAGLEAAVMDALKERVNLEDTSEVEMAIRALQSILEELQSLVPPDYEPPVEMSSRYDDIPF